jgi:hypothetical protein
MQVILIRKGGSSAGGQVKVTWLAARATQPAFSVPYTVTDALARGPNKATGAAYTQVAIVDVSSEEEIEEL